MWREGGKVVSFTIIKAVMWSKLRGVGRLIGSLNNPTIGASYTVPMIP